MFKKITALFFRCETLYFLSGAVFVEIITLFHDDLSFKWIETYQGLIAGFMALAAGVLAYMGPIYRYREEKRDEQAKRLEHIKILGASMSMARMIIVLAKVDYLRGDLRGFSKRVSSFPTIDPLFFNHEILTNLSVEQKIKIDSVAQTYQKIYNLTYRKCRNWHVMKVNLDDIEKYAPVFFKMCDLFWFQHYTAFICPDKWQSLEEEAQTILNETKNHD